MSRQLLFIGKGTYLNPRNIVQLIRWAPTVSERAHYEIHTSLSHLSYINKKKLETPFAFKIYEDEPEYQNVTSFIDSQTVGDSQKTNPLNHSPLF